MRRGARWVGWHRAMARAAPDGETRIILAIAAPLAVAQIGQMAMMLTASMVLGRLDSVALAAGGLSTGLTAMLTLITQGTLASLQPIIAQARGSGGDSSAVQARTLAGAWLLSLLVSLPLILLLTHITPLLRLFGVTADVAGYAGQFCRAYAWGIPAMLCSAPLRYYLASLERTRIVMWVSFIVAGVHFPLNWLWVLGAGDARGQGIAGAGYALSLCWWLMLVGLALYSARQRLLPPGMLRLPARELRTAVGALLRIGWPIGGLYAAEMGLISFSSLLAGQFGAVSLSAHMVCMNVANIIFMVPLSLGQAATVRVAFFTGRLQPRHCRRAGNRALALGAVVMLCAAATLALFGQHILRVFIAPTDRQFAAIDALTARLFAILACHMVFDGMQTIAAGALRGLKDTRYPLVICLAGYWGIACPCALVLAFGLSWGAVGLWSGYALGLAVVAGLLLLRWRTLIGRRLKMRPIPAVLPPCA